MLWKPNFRKNGLCIVLLVLGSGCKSTGGQLEDRAPNGTALESPKGFPDLKIKQVTESGWSARPQAVDQNTIVFVSGRRSDHEQAQAYELQIESGRQRRITFQDGDVFDIVPAPNSDGFFYSSSTDEIKENPDYIREALGQLKGASKVEIKKDVVQDLAGRVLPRTEIYQSSADGNRIDRITDAPGFDGKLSAAPQAGAVYFSHFETDNKTIFRYDLKSKRASVIGGRKTSASYATVLNKNQLAWIATEKTENPQWSIWVGDLQMGGGKLVYRTANPLVDLAWHPDGRHLLFSEGFPDSKVPNFELMLLQLDPQCVTRLTYHSALDLHPTVLVKKDQELLFFDSSRKTESTQLFQLDLKKRPPCPVEK